ncbi:MAG: 30S ribosome-binding factor RbfA [Ignavibacteriales bacterium]|nr:30S ribosome-binding factor RbfA [Ignavibacteriales bacterium]
MSTRKEKFTKLIKEELSWIFIKKIQDPLFNFITITRVKITPDLKQAYVYLSIYDKTKREKLLDKITEIKGLIRTEFAHRNRRLRFIPEFVYFIDETVDHVEKIETLLKQIHENDNKNET